MMNEARAAGGAATLEQSLENSLEQSLEQTVEPAGDFLTVPEIARDAGVTVTTVHNWLKYHRYMEWRRLLDRPVIHREEYARFKREHEELVKS